MERIKRKIEQAIFPNQSLQRVSKSISTQLNLEPHQLTLYPFDHDQNTGRIHITRTHHNLDQVITATINAYEEEQYTISTSSQSHPHLIAKKANQTLHIFSLETQTSHQLIITNDNTILIEPSPQVAPSLVAT
jgi:hypothetical protein